MRPALCAQRTHVAARMLSYSPCNRLKRLPRSLVQTKVAPVLCISTLRAVYSHSARQLRDHSHRLQNAVLSSGKSTLILDTFSGCACLNALVHEQRSYGVFPSSFHILSHTSLFPCVELSYSLQGHKQSERDMTPTLEILQISPS